MKKNIKKIFKKNKYIFLFITILGFILYGNVIHGPFLYDDLYMIVRDRHIHSLTHIIDYFTKSSTEGFDYTSNLYRPIALLTNAITYHFFGLNEVIYHIRNIALHIINSYLVFLIFKKLSFKHITSFIVALLFLSHPVKLNQ